MTSHTVLLSSLMLSVKHMMYFCMAGSSLMPVQVLGVSISPLTPVTFMTFFYSDQKDLYS